MRTTRSANGSGVRRYDRRGLATRETDRRRELAGRRGRSSYGPDSYRDESYNPGSYRRDSYREGRDLEEREDDYE
ncbi:MAG TPA: hypothetical protein VI731_06545, partial [Bacteroidia bacterium]|nr:hypothetical protein [Bacteroidia bacterium]